MTALRAIGDNYYEVRRMDEQGKVYISHHWAVDSFMLTAELIDLGWLVLSVKEVEPPEEEQE